MASNTEIVCVTVKSVASILSSPTMRPAPPFQLVDKGERVCGQLEHWPTKLMPTVSCLA